MYDSVDQMFFMLRIWVRQLMRLEGKTWEDTRKEMGISKKGLWLFLHDTASHPANPHLATLRAVEAWCRRYESIPGGKFRGEKKA